MIGKIGHGGNKLLQEINKRKNITYLRNVDDQLLIKLYNIATIFLFPSLYEGFGFPPLEAMQSGLPVLASDSTSLVEIIDSGGILHKPNDHSSFVQDIFRLIENKDFYNEVRKRGIQRARAFNLEKTALNLVDSFSLLKNN
jgi:glycosyltransferase involved in cell wall biosynthesis